MVSKAMLFPLLFLLGISISNAQRPPSPDKLYGQLFKDVQLQKIYPDQKTFLDCTPKRKVSDIMYDYGMMKGPGMDLKKFVEDNFNLPPAAPQLNYIQQEKNLSNHIKNLWSTLKVAADTTTDSTRFNPFSGNSLLPLPYPYIVPGGRFRELHYWDSYFIMLGLKETGETTMIENMVKNFAYLINTYGYIPGGNRSYYLTRSQPPFFSLMVEMLAKIKGNSVYKTYLPAMEKEYAWWMEGADQMERGTALKHLVKLDDGSLLNRYWDAGTGPRPESYQQDNEVAEAAANELAKRIKVSSPEALEKILNDKRNLTYTNIRAGAESGWDLSSRWLADEKDITTIQTTDIIPVDLNCLLYLLEMNISKAKKSIDFKNAAALYLQKAIKRKAAILKYCWDSKSGFFYDYNVVTKKPTAEITAAGLFPLYVKIATIDQAKRLEVAIKKYLLKDGGIVTTTKQSGLQWDAPNGYAPLQWIAVKGLNNYDRNALAATIAKRWLLLNEKVFAATGKLVTQYNVEGSSKEAGYGEYKLPDGIGWTNGVYIALKKLYGSD